MANPVSVRLEYETLAAPRAVPLAHVEEELIRLRLEAMVSVSDTGAVAQEQQPMTRACMSNLIVYCDDPKVADALPVQIGLMARHHPARVVLLVDNTPDQSQEIVAKISVGLTHLGKRPQISSEQIRLSAPLGGHGRLPSAARPFLIGDLPTALWWNTNKPPGSGGELFSELERMATSIVYDSRGWRDPRAGLVSTAAWALGGNHPTLVTDLAWMRTAVWRRLFAEALAPHVLPGALPHIESLQLRHGPHALPMVWLFVGWLAECLDWKPTGGKFTSDKQLKLNFQSAKGPVAIDITRCDEGPAELRQAKIITRGLGMTAPKIEAEFEALDGDRVAIRIGNPQSGCDGGVSENIVSTPNEPVVLMLARQLANRTGQPEFRMALKNAQVLAKEFSS